MFGFITIIIDNITYVPISPPFAHFHPAPLPFPLAITILLSVCGLCLHVLWLILLLLLFFYIENILVIFNYVNF